MSTNNYLDIKKDWITQAEAARLKGVSRQAINNLIKKGRLKTLVIASVTFVDKEDILSFSRLKAGRPIKLNNGQTSISNP